MVLWTYGGGSGADGVLTGVGAVTAPGCPGRCVSPWPTRSGRDLYINVPVAASSQYIQNLANLFAFGSDGVNPYTAPTANPVWAPLNSNLKVYIEFSNEIWNRAFAQAGTRATAGATNCRSGRCTIMRRATRTTPCIPAAAPTPTTTDDHRPAFINTHSTAEAAWLATYNAHDPAAATWRLTAGVLQQFRHAQRLPFTGWVALRLEQISTAFKAAFGETGDQRRRARPPRAAAVRVAVRRRLVWALGGMKRCSASQHPVDYYLYGGGGGWYADDTDSGFNDARFANPNFAKPDGQRLQQADPAGHELDVQPRRQRSTPASPPTAAAWATPPRPRTARRSVGASTTADADRLSASRAPASASRSTSAAARRTSPAGLRKPLARLVRAEHYHRRRHAPGESEGGAGFSGQPHPGAGTGRPPSTSPPASTPSPSRTPGPAATATVFLDDLGIQTVNGLFNQTAAGGSRRTSPRTSCRTSPSASSTACTTWATRAASISTRTWAATTSTATATWAQGYSSGTPNVATMANLDPRTEALAITTLDQFYSAGGTLPIVFESAGNINSWAVAAPTYYNYNTPKQQAVAAVEAALPPAAPCRPIGPAMVRHRAATRAIYCLRDRRRTARWTTAGQRRQESIGAATAAWPP